MTTLREPAWAKINLALDVGAKRPDGFHDMRMIMQTISLHDDVELRVGSGRWWADGPEGLPHDERNLALKAAIAFCRAAEIEPDGIEVSLTKRIPSLAGLGGGSADAAAVLRALNRHYQNMLSADKMLQVAAEVGSDVPFCLVGGTKLAEGRGEILSELPPMPDCCIVLCQPSFGSSTPALFRAIDEAPPTERPDFTFLTTNLHDLARFAPAMGNVFEPVLARDYPIIETLKHTMRENGALGAMLTGTGSVVFGLFDNASIAEAACDKLNAIVPWAVCATPIHTV